MEGNQFIAVVALIIHGLCILHSTACFFNLPRTDECSKDFKQCGGGHCCCSADTVICSGFGRNLTYIPHTPFRHSLFFQNNFLPKIEQETFTNITSPSKLNELRACNNDVRYVTNDAFRKLTLIVLDLSDNFNLNLTSLSVSFKDLGHLKRLVLQNVGITDVSHGIFANLNESRLNSLDLSRNKITTLDFSYVWFTKGLATLKLESCHIQKVKVTSSLMHLKILSLRDNLLTQAPPTLCLDNSNITGFPSLKRIDLSDNLFSDLGNDILNCVQNITSLQLSGNVITVLRNNTFAKFSELVTLYFENMANKLERIEPLAFNLSRLRRLSLMNNNIHFAKGDNALLLKGLTGLRSLQLSNNNFYGINAEVMVDMFSSLKSLSKLTIGASKISNISALLVRQLPNLSSCDLYDNSIKEIKGAFDNATKLKHLRLKDNRINIIRPDDFAMSLFQTLEVIDLSSNPYNCTCDLMWFRLFIGDTGTINNKTRLDHWPGRYFCHDAGTWMLLEKYRPTPEICSFNNPFRKAMIVLSSVVFVAIITSAIAFRKRWYLRYWCYKLRKQVHRGERLPLLQNREFIYDAYVIYNDEDSEFVHGELLALLEGRMNNTLHIWHRDAANGSKLSVMVDAIYASRSVIAVVSSHFFQDSWCNFQMEIAFDRDISSKQENVFLVILNDFEYRPLDKYWCVILTRTPSATWCDNEEDIQRKVFDGQIEKFMDRIKNKHFR